MGRVGGSLGRPDFILHMGLTAPTTPEKLQRGGSSWMGICKGASQRPPSRLSAAQVALKPRSGQRRHSPSPRSGRRGDGPEEPLLSRVRRAEGHLVLGEHPGSHQERKGGAPAFRRASHPGDACTRRVPGPSPSRGCALTSGPVCGTKGLCEAPPPSTPVHPVSEKAP